MSLFNTCLIGSLFLLFFFLLGVHFSCHTIDHDVHISADLHTELVAQAFFKTFAERTDWEKFCSYYREDMQFEDIILQIKLDSLWQFQRFYKWNDTINVFTKLNPNQEHLTIFSLITDSLTAVARGRFNPFYYNEQLVDPFWGMEFTIWLYFDDQRKIIKQIDWIEYDDFTLENVIRRCRQNGVMLPPEWLDLSRESN